MVREMFVPLEAPTGPRAVRLRAGVGVHRGQEAQDPLLLDVAASQRRHIHKGISWGDHGGVLRRACSRRSPSWAECRRASCSDNLKIAVAKILGGGRRKRTSTFNGASVALPVQRQVRPELARATTRVLSRAWWDTAEGTSWCRSRGRRTSMSFNAHLESECLERM